MKYGVSLTNRSRNRVKGLGMFRKNIPVIERYFNYMMNEAIKATSQGQELV
jgi:hypothetical protein